MCDDSYPSVSDDWGLLIVGFITLYGSNCAGVIAEFHLKSRHSNGRSPPDCAQSSGWLQILEIGWCIPLFYCDIICVLYGLYGFYVLLDGSIYGFDMVVISPPYEKI